MSFEIRETEETNLETYKQLKRQALQFTSQLTTWENQFQALRASVTADKQAELDAKKTQLITQLRNVLGI